MANYKQPGGVLYLLCLPRIVLQKIYDLHLTDENSADLENTYRLFGRKKFAFADPLRCRFPAPIHEFGILRATLKMRNRIYETLPDSYKDIIDEWKPVDVPFGPYVDRERRYYKFESDNTMTVMLPKGKGHADDLTFPNVGDTIIIEHVHNAMILYSYKVVYHSYQQGNSLLIHIEKN